MICRKDGLCHREEDARTSCASLNVGRSHDPGKNKQFKEREMAFI
jgi:hypothetical protein